MSYLAQYQLTYDSTFVYRSRACLTEQAMIYKDDPKADFAALANAILINAAGPQLTFQSMLGNINSFADAAETPDGGVDHTQITDAELLTEVQGLWPTVAALYFKADGTPKT